jgi:thioredoxin reductase/SAM-dependent methyltransferase
MSEHQHLAFERHCDVAVIGGSAAGLAAGLQLGRQRRSVIVVDSATPRNAAATHLHGYLGREAIAPAQLIADGREEVRSYGGEVLTARAERVVRDHDRFRVELVGGHVVAARRVLAATGLIDELPDIEGLSQHWGGAVIHCPFCHGYEVRDQRIAQIVTHPAGLHSAPLFRQLSALHTVVLHGGVEVDQSAVDLLEAGGVTVVRGQARRVVTADTGRVSGLELTDGSRIEADAIVVGPRFRARVEPFSALGLQTTAHPSGLGDVVEVDANGATSVPGLYAAGNVTDPSQQVSAAAAHGSRIGAMISFDLAHDDLRAAARVSGNQADWDHRYSGEPLWSGNPNGTLVQEASGLPPASALDVGAGEGGDAMWLAEQGWTVTASDISRRVLDRIAAAAVQRGVPVACLHADANALDAFPAATFDLVCAQYASIPRTPDQRGVHSILDAVAPGGTLIVVGHDLQPMRQPLDSDQESRPFDADAFVRVDDFAAVLTGSAGWEIEIHEKRPRPPGAASASHHVDDIVLRARRRQDAKP